mgnify:FL=1
MVKSEIKKSLFKAIQSKKEWEEVNLASLRVEIKDNKEKNFGDFSTNIALILAQKLKESPKKIADKLIKKFPPHPSIKKIEFSKPGFINFYLIDSHYSEILKIIKKEKEKFGLNKTKDENKKILIEYVSSNPTGPLHVGHGRGAAFGSVLSNILRASGHKVDEEYYVNDQGRQIDILTLSVFLRCEQLLNNDFPYPKFCYQGEYINSYAEQIIESSKEKGSKGEVFFIPVDKRKRLIEELKKVKKEEDLDVLISFARRNLENKFIKVKEFVLEQIVHSIKLDLSKMGVNQNLWFTETKLYKSQNKKPSLIDEVKNILERAKLTYEEGGALWFKSSQFKDDKDRVIEKENGQTTYFASDIAYHAHKYGRGYDKIINVWGSDHHGYLPRVKSAMSALGLDPDKLEVIFIQFATLIKENKKISMSTRGGQFITLDELMKEVSPEATRFFFINRKAEQHLSFDLDLAKKQSKDNPLYYIQYAHARICSILKNLELTKRKVNSGLGEKNLNLLNGEKEEELLKILSKFPEVVLKSSDNYEPHLICYYLKDLSSSFHGYYNEEKILVDKEEELQAKILLLQGVKQVIFNGLTLLGVSSPSSM